MRMSRIFDEGGGYYANSNPDYEGSDPSGIPQDPGENTPGGQANPPAAPPPASPQAPTGGEDPGPAEPTPPGSGNPPAPKKPTPPAVPSAVQGIKANEATGGVEGSFGQAGTAGFAKRFGSPASWFRGAGLGAERDTLMRDMANRGRGVLRGGGANVGGNTVAVVAGPTDYSADASGGKNDEQWQRLMAEVLKQRFGG